MWRIPSLPADLIITIDFDPFERCPPRKESTKRHDTTAADRQLARLTAICRGLPEATRDRVGSHAGFLVRKRTFAYYLADHNGDSIVAVACKVAPGENAELAKGESERFYLPAYIGARGWVGLRLDVGKPGWREVSEFVARSYRRVAPARLARPSAQSVD